MQSNMGYNNSFRLLFSGDVERSCIKNTHSGFNKDCLITHSCLENWRENMFRGISK